MFVISFAVDVSQSVMFVSVIPLERNRKSDKRSTERETDVKHRQEYMMMSTKITMLTMRVFFK